VPVIGAHVEARHGLWNAFPNAVAVGADAIQVHPTPPGFWGSPKPSEEDVEHFRQAYADAGRPPFYFHAVYLINLASEDPKVNPRSESTLAGYLAAADSLGIDGVIFHVAGTGGCVGARFEEIRAMIDAVGDERVRSCFDTCHAFASGYDLRTPAGAKAVIDDWERLVGLDRLEAVHANDSMTGLGSNRDRHQNIGLGEIGEDGFRALLHDPRLAKVPFILEVPGFEGLGPDAENVAILRRLAA